MNCQSESGSRRHKLGSPYLWVGVAVAVASTLLLISGCMSHALPETSATSSTPRAVATSTVAQTSRALIPVPTEQSIYGYIDQNGKWVIKPQFEVANGFSEGFAAVTVKEKDGYIDQAGHIVISPQYAYADNFSEGFALVATSNQTIEGNQGLRAYTWIDKTGRKISTATWDHAQAFSEGLAAVGRGKLTGYVDTTGKLVIPLKFEYATSFSEGLAAVRMNGKWGYIDKSGAWVIPPQFGYMTNRAPLISLGEVASSALRYGAGAFRNAVAPVAVLTSTGGYRFFYIDKTGKKVFDSDYELAGEFSEGLAPVLIGGKWGYIGPQGKVVIKPQFDGPGPGMQGLDAGHTNSIVDAGYLIFQNGLAEVSLSGKTGFIDRSGKFVIPLPYKDPVLEPFDTTTGTATIMSMQAPDFFVVINSKGKVIYQVFTR